MISLVTESQVIEVFKTIFDPEFRVDIYNLGLVYDIDIHEEKDSKASIKLSLTTPACPAAGPILSESKYKLQQLFQGDVKVELTFEPKWKPSMITRDGIKMLPSQLVDFLDFDE